MTDVKAELLPCPFCGADAGITLGLSAILCTSCLAEGPATTPEGIIALWNTRPQPSPKVDGLVERAREAWDRILNMDGGQPQTIAAGLWATIYADALIHIAEQVQP